MKKALFIVMGFLMISLTAVQAQTSPMLASSEKTAPSTVPTIAPGTVSADGNTYVTYDGKNTLTVGQTVTLGIASNRDYNFFRYGFKAFLAKPIEDDHIDGNKEHTKVVIKKLFIYQNVAYLLFKDGFVGYVIKIEPAIREGELLVQ